MAVRHVLRRHARATCAHYYGGATLEPLYATIGVIALVVAWGGWRLRPWAYRASFVLQGLVYVVVLGGLVLWIAGKSAPVGWLLLDAAFGAYNLWWLAAAGDPRRVRAAPSVRRRGRMRPRHDPAELRGARMTVEKLFVALFNAGPVRHDRHAGHEPRDGVHRRAGARPVRRVWVFVAALCMNVVIVPPVAWGIFKLFPLTSRAASSAWMLVCIASAGPAGLKAAQLAKRADMALAVSLVIVLQLVNIVAAPLWARAVVTGASVSAWTIIKDLLILVLVPLVLGLVGMPGTPSTLRGLEGRAREDLEHRALPRDRDRPSGQLERHRQPAGLLGPGRGDGHDPRLHDAGCTDRT